MFLISSNIVLKNKQRLNNEYTIYASCNQGMNNQSSSMDKTQAEKYLPQSNRSKI